MDVDGGDLVASRDDVIGQTDSESIDDFDLGGVLRRDDSLDVPPIAALRIYAWFAARR